ncbi:MAG: hypothetical protein H6540_02500 [Bacteroidales bacterium]|nr:hypothetical protein [Bacteroidales bacterium]
MPAQPTKLDGVLVLIRADSLTFGQAARYIRDPETSMSKVFLDNRFYNIFHV